MIEIDNVRDFLCNVKEAMKPYFYPKSDVDVLLASKSDNGHNHDDKYYTESEMDSKLNGKSNTNHNHDTRYYQQSIVDEKLGEKADVNHIHTVDSTLSASSTNPVQNKVVKSALDGKSNSNHSHGDVTTSSSGFMSKTMLTKLNGIQDNANKTIVDSSLSGSSTNPVQNKVINNALNNKAGLDVATIDNKGLMSNRDKIKLDSVGDGAIAKKKVLGWYIHSTSDSTNQGLIIIRKGGQLTVKLFNSEDGTLEGNNVSFVPNLGIHYNLNGVNRDRDTGSTGDEAKINISHEFPIGDHIMNFVFHGSGNYYPAYRTIILRVTE